MIATALKHTAKITVDENWIDEDFADGYTIDVDVSCECGDDGHAYLTLSRDAMPSDVDRAESDALASFATDHECISR